jgi:hypothetical protein
VRWKFAIGLWISAFCILAWAANNLDPVFDWHGWLRVGWHFGRIAFLCYAGFLLVQAQEEIDGLKYTRDRLEEAIGEWQRSHS